MLIALLAASLLLVAGCKDEQPAANGDQTVIQLPDGMEAQIGVGSRDEDDENDSSTETPDNNTGEDTLDNNTGTEIPGGSTGEDTPGGNTSDQTPDNNQSGDTKPDENKPDDTQLPAPGELDYLGFYALTEDQQDAYIESFESLAAFNKWFNEARAEYESQLPEDEIIDGEIDLDKYNP